MEPPCPYRIVCDVPAGRGWTCRLAAGWVSGSQDGDCLVCPRTCAACCRHGAAPECGINPVVGSLVCQAVDRVLERGSLNADQTLDLLHVRQFALEHLQDLTGSAWRVPAGIGGTEKSRWNLTIPAEHARPRALRPRADAGIRRHLRIGLVGPADQRGLGHQNRDLARQLPVDRWLVPWHDSAADADGRSARRAAPVDCAQRELEEWLSGLDWVIFVERPHFVHLAPAARAVGTAVACIVNHEWIHPGLNWLSHVDLMIAPTRFTARRLRDWRTRLGFCWSVCCLPWPINARSFRFRMRRRCERFVFVNGAGGVRPRQLDGRWAPYRRKGLEILCVAARRVPDIPILVYSQTDDLPDLPANVTPCHPPPRNSLLYRCGDVCVQPSHWEGLGLTLLECQAAGLPLITTDALPMSEHNPLRAIPAAVHEVVSLPGSCCVIASQAEPALLARAMRSLYQTDISRASQAARAFIEREHPWEAGWQALREWLSVDAANRKDECFAPVHSEFAATKQRAGTRFEEPQGQRL